MHSPRLLRVNSPLLIARLPKVQSQIRPKEHLNLGLNLHFNFKILPFFPTF